ALYLPADGSAVATVLARALIGQAQALGVTFRPHSPVTAVEVVDGHVRGVQTENGRIETETLVIAAGIWSPLVGRLAGVELPLVPAPGVRGFWSACGFCAHGVSGAGGVGKVMAEWIANGDPGLDVSAMALARFREGRLGREAVREAACRVYRTYYDIARA